MVRLMSSAHHLHGEQSYDGARARRLEPFFTVRWVNLQSFPKKIYKVSVSTTHIPPASQNGREAQHARAVDRNLVNIFSEMTVPAHS